MGTVVGVGAGVFVGVGVGSAVVSQHSQVHGIDGLRVADASVMPDVIRANINATTIMISERVSEFITAGANSPKPTDRRGE